MPASVERELTDGWRWLRIGPPLNKNQECKLITASRSQARTYPCPYTTQTRVHARPRCRPLCRRSSRSICE